MQFLKMTRSGNCDAGENDNNQISTQNKLNNEAIFGIFTTKTNNKKKNQSWIFLKKFVSRLPTVYEIRQCIGVIICGLTLWATSWFLFDKAVLPGGYAFDMTAVVLCGYIFGHTLERYTTINAVVGMTLMGAFYRNMSSYNILEYPVADAVDYHLRRVCAVIILTKGPLGWNWYYIRNNPIKVFALATLPWSIECLSTAVISHIWLSFPWYWGLHLGAILASVSPAIIVPTTMSFTGRGLGTKNQVGLLVANAGGLDTAFTEGIFGIINCSIFYPSSTVYRITKGLLAIFVGIALGIAWGILADLLPDHNDPYAPTIRSLHILVGGLLTSYCGTYFGWGGVSGVAIMVCAGTAATRWQSRGWPLGDNPVFEVYKLLWRIFEPVLFALSGYFFEVSKISLKEFGVVLGCILLALLLRMITAVLVCIASDLSVKESLFVAVTWIPKAVVEAVLVRVATDSLWKDDATIEDKRVASQHANIIVIAILITSTLGSALTTVLGPILLSQDSRVAPED